MEEKINQGNILKQYREIRDVLKREEKNETQTLKMIHNDMLKRNK